MPEKYPTKHLACLEDGRLVTTHIDRIRESDVVLAMTLEFRTRQNDLFSDLAPDRLRDLVFRANDNAFHRLLHAYGARLTRFDADALADLVQTEVLLLNRAGIYYQDLVVTVRIQPFVPA